MDRDRSFLAGAERGRVPERDAGMMRYQRPGLTLAVAIGGSGALLLAGQLLRLDPALVFVLLLAVLLAAAGLGRPR